MMLWHLVAEYDVYVGFLIFKDHVYHDQLHKINFMTLRILCVQLSVISYIHSAVQLSWLSAPQAFITANEYFVTNEQQVSIRLLTSAGFSSVSRICLFWTCHVSTVFVPFIPGFFGYVDTMF